MVNPYELLRGFGRRYGRTRYRNHPTPEYPTTNSYQPRSNCSRKLKRGPVSVPESTDASVAAIESRVRVPQRPADFHGFSIVLGLHREHSPEIQNCRSRISVLANCQDSIAGKLVRLKCRSWSSSRRTLRAQELAMGESDSCSACHTLGNRERSDSTIPVRNPVRLSLIVRIEGSVRAGCTDAARTASKSETTSPGELRPARTRRSTCVINERPSRRLDGLLNDTSGTAQNR